MVEAPGTEGVSPPRAHQDKSSSPQGVFLPTLLSLNAGFVDTAGFLTLQGLFTAHVTGNFVTLGAALVLGGSGATAKLLALPIFCLVVILTRLASYGLTGRNIPVLRTMLSLKVLLLATGGALAIVFGPFKSGDDLPAVATGLALVAAMAIQNAAQRIHLSKAPPTTLMTGTTTQIMIDGADWIRGSLDKTQEAKRARLRQMSVSVAAFAFGCAAAALSVAKIGVWSFLIPPLIGLLALVLRLSTYPGDVG